MTTSRRPAAGTIAASPRLESVPNTSLERLGPERGAPARQALPRSAVPTLAVAHNARDQTLGRSDRHRAMDRLFWALVVAPAVLAGLAIGPLAALLAVPAQLLAAILAGTLAARHRQCGALTLAALPVSAAALLWALAAL